MVKSKETTVGFENSSEAATWELQLRDLTRNVIAHDSIEVVSLVATSGIKLVLELHKCLNMVGTTTRKSSNKSEAWSKDNKE